MDLPLIQYNFLKYTRPILYLIQYNMIKPFLPGPGIIWKRLDKSNYIVKEKAG